LNIPSMKVLLINPITELIQRSRKLKTFVAPILPMGIGSLAAVINEMGVEVKVIDQFANRISDSALLNEIKAYSPDMIGFSCLTQAMHKVEILVREIRKFSEAVIVLGGIHPTLFADQLLSSGVADVIVRGEGERSIAEVITAMQQKSGLSQIKGISFSNEGRIFHNEDRPLVEDLDKLPYPAWNFFELEYYREAPLALITNELAIPVLGSRGCPYKCMFCAQDIIYPRPRYRSSLGIIKEMEYFHGKFKAKRFGFIDANFPFSVEFGLEFCADLIRSGLHKKIRWATETRVNLVNEELLIMMKKAGVDLIMFGFEVGSQRILNKINKNTALDQSRKVMQIVKKLKINTLGLFMLGLPGETKDDCEETIRFAKELNPTIAKFNIAIPYPGSKFYLDFCKEGKNISDPEKFASWHDWGNDNSEELIYVPDGMTSKDMLGFQRRAMFEFYARPGIIWDFIIHRRVGLKKLIYGAYILLSRYFLYLKNRFWNMPSHDFIGNESALLRK